VLDVLARNEVDVETLRLFQEADYDELGISIGARRKIVAQLRRQEARATTRPALAPRSSSTASSEPSRRGEAARRVATPPRPSTPGTAESRPGSTRPKRRAASRSQTDHRPPPQVQTPHAALRESPERVRPVHAVNGVSTPRRSPGPRRTTGGTGAALTPRPRGRGGRCAKGSPAQQEQSRPRLRGRGRRLPKAAAVGPVAEPTQDRLAPLFDALLSAGAERGGARVDSMVALLARSQ